jgi:hypothetical protein
MQRTKQEKRIASKLLAKHKKTEATEIQTFRLLGW